MIFAANVGKEREEVWKVGKPVPARRPEPQRREEPTPREEPAEPVGPVRRKDRETVPA